MGFKIGQNVKVKEWDDMLNEYGFDTDHIKTKFNFYENMKPLCGLTGIIKKIKTNDCFIIEFDNGYDAYTCFGKDEIIPLICIKSLLNRGVLKC